MQETIVSRRDVPEDPLIRSVGAGGISDYIKKIQNPLAIGCNPKKALPLPAGFRANEVGQTCLGKMKVQFIRARGQRNVIPKLADPDVAINVRIQRSKDSLRRTDLHRTAGIEAVRGPCPPAAVDVGIGGAYDHPQIFAA